MPASARAPPARHRLGKLRRKAAGGAALVATAAAAEATAGRALAAIALAAALAGRAVAEATAAATAARTVATGAVAAGGAIAGRTASSLLRHGAGGGARGLLQGVGHHIRGEVEVLAQVLDALVGEVPVVVPPRELALDQLLGREGLHELDHLQVGHLLDLGVSREVKVLLGIDDPLPEEVFVHLLTVLLGNKHGACCLSTTAVRLEG
mmetsp:Transcript_38276/g.95120  ORF Transcript_38276/g.95120 Transcript_38276/m.95120 type:complete len:208 (-) Transcript_38276:115-738(-)